MIELFWDAGQRCFFDTGSDHEELLLRPRDVFDSAIPSGGSTAAMALLRLAVFTGDGEYERYAASSLRSVRDFLIRAPSGLANWLAALDFYLSTVKEIVVIGDRDDADGEAARRDIRAVAQEALGPPPVLQPPLPLVFAPMRSTSPSPLLSLLSQ
jgi:uncharacterized protein YyaL (SSP411 family)